MVQKTPFNMVAVFLSICAIILCYQGLSSVLKEVLHDVPVGYVREYKDFEEEAKDIKRTYGPKLSQSKIKHLLIYVDGLCKHYDIDYDLVKAIIATESGWRHKAKSSMNCLGLMQVSRGVAIDYKTPHSQMYDIYINVTIGINHLARLKTQLDKNTVAKLLVAYNQGLQYANRMSAFSAGIDKYVRKVMALVEV